jgi:8-oxo-dGTP pyrophosphatase MutT (NUDIX family)
MSLPVIALDRLDIAFVPRRWSFVEERRAEIDAHFAECRARQPQMWNGRILLTNADYRIADRRLSGTCFESDFATLLAWRDWGFPDAGAVNCFAMGALRCADGGFLLGVMGGHTANAGHVYFPAGTPEPDDIVDGCLDLAGSVTREIEEETGLTAAAYAASPQWHVVLAGPRLAAMKLLIVNAPAIEVQQRIRDFLAREENPELSDIRIVRGPGDFDERMPPYVIAYLEHFLRG